MKIILLFITYLFMTSNALSVVELSKEELREYKHIKKIPIAFANWGKKQLEVVVDPDDVCKGARGNDKQVGVSRKMKITKDINQINYATKCNKFGFGYKEFFRTYTDELADSHCALYDKLAIYAGEASFKVQPISRMGQVVAGFYSFGIGNTKVHVSSSYFCSLEKDPKFAAQREELKVAAEKAKKERERIAELAAIADIKEKERIMKLSDSEICTLALNDEGEWKTKKMKEQKIFFIKKDIYKRNMTLDDCQNITGIYPEEKRIQFARADYCYSIGFKADTPEFGNCILKLMEIAAIQDEAEAMEKLAESNNKPSEAPQVIVAPSVTPTTNKKSTGQKLSEFGYSMQNTFNQSGEIFKCGYVGCSANTYKPPKPSLNKTTRSSCIYVGNGMTHCTTR